MPFSSVIRNLEDERLRKMVLKLPSWAALCQQPCHDSGPVGIVIPSSLSLEQCSSEATAAYKARVVSRAGMLADLTGGLGVDSHAFSKVCGKVIYCERDEALCNAAGSNFRTLGASNIEVRRLESSPDTAGSLPDCDWIFVDPARRGAGGRKVFLLEDCTPDVLTMLPAMLAKAPRIMLKLSPMADLTMAVTRLESASGAAARVREVHILGSGGECKELLIVMERGFTGEMTVTLSDDCMTTFTYTLPQESGAALRYAEGLDCGDLLFEPSAVLMKAGCHHLISSSTGFAKLDRFTHVYVSKERSDHALARMGRMFRVIYAKPLTKSSAAEAGRMWPRASVVARNIMMSSEDLKKRLRIKDGGEVQVFGLLAGGRKMLAVAEKVR